MIYVTGDVHGDISRFKSKALRKLRKNDYLIICGDFGFVWDGSDKEKKRLRKLGRRRYHVLFVDGSHDNHNLLDGYPVKEWNGGLVREISGKLRLLCRGGVFEIDGKTVFAFGGGDSDQITGQLLGANTVSEHYPNHNEVQAARKNLLRHENRVDYIVTHQPSGKIKSMLSPKINEPSFLDVFFDELRSACKYKKWFFGSIHADKLVPPLEVSLFEAFAEMRGDCTLIGAKRKWRMRQF